MIETSWITHALVRWVSAGRQPETAEVEGGGVVLSFGPRTRALWLGMSACSLGFLLLGVVAAASDEDMGTVLLPAYFTLFTVLCAFSLLCLLRAYFYSVRVDDHGLEVTLPGGRRDRIAWPEIAGLGYSKVHDSLVLKRKEKRAVRIALELDGVAHLRRALERRFSPLPPALEARLLRNEGPIWV